MNKIDNKKDAFFHGLNGLAQTWKEVKEDDFDIFMVAAALTNINRYAGKCIGELRSISVAEHSMYMVYHLVNKEGITDKKLLFSALLHDAPEMFIGDMHTVIKQDLRGSGHSLFDEMDEHFMELICKKFGAINPKEFPIIAEVDKKLREHEREYLFCDAPSTIYGRFKNKQEIYKEFIQGFGALQP